MNATTAIPKQKSYPGIDLVRFVCALLVISAHVYPFGNNGDPLLSELNFWVHCLPARLTVPFFFMCTGFFLFRDSDREPMPAGKVWRYEKKQLRLYLLWTLLYLPLILQEIVLAHPDGIGSGMARAVRNLLLCGSYHHLWYLHGSLVAVGITGWLRSRGIRFSRMLPVAAVLFLVGVLPQAYFGILMRLRERIPMVWKVWETYEKFFVTTRNGLFEGFLYVALGAWLAQGRCRLSLKVSAVGFGISAALAVAELYLCRKLRLLGGYDLYVFQVPAAFFLFCLASRLELGNSALWPHLRTMAGITYFTHVWVYKLLAQVFAAAGWDLTVPGVYFLSTTALTLLLAEGLIRLQKKPKFSFIGQLYG